MRPPSWRHGFLVRAALAFAIAATLVVSLWSVNALVDLSSTDTDAPGSAASAPQSSADSVQTGTTPARGQAASESTTSAERAGTRNDAARSTLAQDWPGPLPSLIGSALTQVPDAHQPATAPRSPDTTGGGDESDTQGPGTPGPPSITPPDAPPPPKADTRMASKALSSATATVMAVPRTINGIDVDAYVRKYSTEMGSQIQRVERQITRSVPDISPPGTRPKDSDNTKQTTQRPRGDVRGIDVSGWQKNVNWKYWWNKGKRFAYVKATEGTGYKNPYYSQQYNGSRNVGMIRGAYHFALPNRSSGAAQAVYFTTNGGGWTRDGKTLPGALDLEWNPYGPACYGKSKAGMRAWIKSFHDTYKARTDRWPVIYTSTSWWNHCVGGGHSFGRTVPLWVARYSNNVGALPLGWSRYTFWQYSSDPIDQNKFNGKYARLRALANG